MIDFGIDSGAFGVYIGAVLFGVVYNAFIAWMRTNGHGDGLVSLFVAGGVSATLALSFLIIPWPYAVAVVGLFVASGLPMIAGSLWRYINSLREAVRDSADGH